MEEEEPEETLPGLKQRQIEFENSSKNSDQLARGQLAENDDHDDNNTAANKDSSTVRIGGRPTNLIDRLLSERDSQFSNFNDKIDRLRHGHSTTSFKDHRRTGGILNESIGYHSSNSKPKLQRV